MSETMLDLNIENVTAGLRNLGYWVSADPIPGGEQAYYEHLRDGLQKAEKTLEHVHKNARCRGRSKRALERLHKWLPEPCWGVRVIPGFQEGRR